MARVTVEDCVLRVPNRFELVLVAAQRSREIAAGGQMLVERDNDKNPVVALREIAEDAVSVEALRNSLISHLQHHVEADEPEEEEMDALVADRDMSFEAITSDEEAVESGLTVSEDGVEFDADIGDNISEIEADSEE